MKIFHLSDLHIGRQLNYYSLADIQKSMLDQIIDYMKKERPDAVLISGDIYDRSVPSGEAHELFNDFLEKVSHIVPQIPVLMIAGNHDSQERLNYANHFLSQNKIYIEAYPPASEQEHIKRLTLTDEHGEVDFYMLPFVKPSMVRALFENEVGISYNEAVKRLIERENIDFTKRNVLLSHQFYISSCERPETCESEQAHISVGGIDDVDISAVEGFTYVALGHIHGRQQVGRKWIRYSGTPFKYSVSEEHHKKSITVVEIGAPSKNGGRTDVLISELPFEYERDVYSLRGTLDELIEHAGKKVCTDYVSITLTDDRPQYRAKEKLQELYENILEIRIDNGHISQLIYGNDSAKRTMTPLEAFAEFYQLQHGRELDDRQIALFQEVLNEAKGGD